MQTLSQCKFRLEIQSRALLGDRVLEVGDVVDVNPVTREVFVAASLPYDPEALRGLLAAGAATPTEGSAPEAVRLLDGADYGAKPARRGHLHLVHSGDDA